MTVEEIESLGPQLADFLEEFADCFGRSEPRENLAHYIRGQLSDLPRKSAEPMALRAGIAPRTLQVFLSASRWKEPKLRDRLQQVVARDHADSEAIGIIDPTSHKKKGDKTPGVQRQYCGSTGKIDNCIVTVHLGYVTGNLDFATLLDSDLFLPEEEWSDRKRCQAAGIPEEVVYRPKWQIALEQLARAKANGVRLKWVTADEEFGSKPEFLSGLEKLKFSYVVEVPKSTYGWLIAPATLRGKAASRVDALARHSAVLSSKPWLLYRVKDTHKGVVLWQAKVADFAFRQGRQVAKGYRLIVARNALDPAEVKYFLAKAPKDTSLAKLLQVAFARAMIERCFEDTKSELGFSHFEGRHYMGLLRHCYVTQLSHLFLARQTKRLRGKKSGGDPVPSADSGQRAGGQPETAPRPSPRFAGTHR